MAITVHYSLDPDNAGQILATVSIDEPRPNLELTMLGPWGELWWGDFDASGTMTVSLPAFTGTAMIVTQLPFNDEHEQYVTFASTAANYDGIDQHDYFVGDTATGFRDMLKLWNGNDIAFGGGGNDSIFGGEGNDELHGGTGIDRINGDSGNDRLFGDEGDDTLFGGAGTDTIEGGDGEDFIDGGSSTDNIRGGEGADTILGGGGNDLLRGEDGDDVIDGGAGNDNIRAGGGIDALTGGDGADLFIFKAVPDSPYGDSWDTILDFDGAEGDRLMLSEIDANTNLAGDQAFTLVADWPGAAGELGVMESDGDTMLIADTDGDGLVDFAILIERLPALATENWLL
jgi:Ca2+-binding RTX toxin-like protein